MCLCLSLFFSNDPPTTEIYTLSLHDALPISLRPGGRHGTLASSSEEPPERVQPAVSSRSRMTGAIVRRMGDRKSTRLNSSHTVISYAVFCLKKKKKKQNT